MLNLKKALLEAGFHQPQKDYSLFTKESNGNFVVLLVYVDEIVPTGSNDESITELTEHLNLKSHVKDLR